jgi:hypothetical protein
MKSLISKAVCWLRWGRLREQTKSVDGGRVSECAVLSCRSGAVVGYWAYGGFDPFYPYVWQVALWSVHA